MHDKRKVHSLDVSPVLTKTIMHLRAAFLNNAAGMLCHSGLKTFVLVTSLVSIAHLSLAADVAGQPLPNEWWQQAPAEEVFLKAQGITRKVAFLKGTKDQCVDAPTLGFEYFQRPAAPGEIESKVLFNHRGHLSTTEYWLKDGMYTVYGSLILRIEYEDGVQEEKRMARALGERAYTYQLQSSSAATGTNDCFIIRRTMSEPLLAAVDASYAAFAPSLKTKEERLPNISVFHDYYVRKTDGIIMGFLELNAAGHMRGDRLCDIMLLGTAAPDAEFTPPNKSHATVVSSFHQFADLTFDEMLKFENNSPAPAHKGKSYVTMCVVISFSLALLVFLWRASRRRVSW